MQGNRAKNTDFSLDTVSDQMKAYSLVSEIHLPESILFVKDGKTLN